jgi:hypothetical protein
MLKKGGILPFLIFKKTKGGDNMFKELLKTLKDGKAEYCFQKEDLLFISPVQGFKADTDCLEIRFQGGYVKLWRGEEESEIKQVERPANLIIDCKVCYMLKNCKGEFIGYIFER